MRYKNFWRYVLKDTETYQKILDIGMFLALIW